MIRSLKILLFAVFLTASLSGFATHNRAGEITYRHIEGYTYEISIWTYTYTESRADRDELPVSWGDGTASTAPRVEKLELPNLYRRNKYVMVHTYPGPGVYRIVTEDPNRNFGVLNIPNSVNVVFSISTTLLINSMVGSNSTPILMNPPYDKAAVGRLFIHNPAAYDADGDSISYKLTVCTREDGIPIEDYSYPPYTDTLYVNERTGDLIWDSPTVPGYYNIAIYIEEWREGVKIGRLVRDMQIDVYESDNHPPVIEDIPHFCLTAGDSVELIVNSTDEDGDEIKMLHTGGAFYLDDSPAEFEVVDSGYGYAIGNFRWNTNCTHVRQQPYNFVIKAEDHIPGASGDELSLVDISSFYIKVLGPPPLDPRLDPSNESIKLSWSPGVCDEPVGYRIYRRMGYLAYEPDSCTNGVPGSTGYVLAGETSSYEDTSFVDRGGAAGELEQGTVYCYMVVALYPDGAESLPSEEICSMLVQGNPVITNVSVLDTDEENGRIFLAWVTPDELDTIPGPYRYRVYRAEGVEGTSYELINSFESTSLVDTFYVDSLLNTRELGYNYMVELYSGAGGNWERVSLPGHASCMLLGLESSDNMLTITVEKDVPWVNTSYVFFRENDLGGFDSVGVSSGPFFVDTGLENGKEYCYYARSMGSYNRAGLPNELINLSHKACGIPVDNVPPCPPELDVSSICDSLYNQLRWTDPNNYCADDVSSYKIYYKPALDESLQLIGENNSAADTSFRHYVSESLAACYAVTATDSNGNESAFSNLVCVDSCSYYEIPNVFTPNGDDDNDKLVAYTSPYVEKIDLTIYSRGGVPVFETEDPYINWDGKHMRSNKLVSPGVYYYMCDVYERRLSGIEQRHYSGFIHVITEKGARQSNN